jgi:hypothetical protein
MLCLAALLFLSLLCSRIVHRLPVEVPLLVAGEVAYEEIYRDSTLLYAPIDRNIEALAVQDSS